MIATPTRPSTQCPSSSFELELDPMTFLRSLEQFASPAMIVRAGMLSLFRRGRFGAFFDLGGELARDSRSGLSLDPSRIRRICLVADSQAPFAFEVEMEGLGFALAILPGPRDWNTVQSLLASGARSVPLESLRRRGATAWLDEVLSETSAPRAWRHRLVFDRDEGRVTVGGEAWGIAYSSRFQPSIVDRDGGTLRLSDAAGENVVHFQAGGANGDLPAEILPPVLRASSHHRSTP